MLLQLRMNVNFEFHFHQDWKNDAQLNAAYTTLRGQDLVDI